MQKAFADFHKTKDASGKFKENVDKAQREVNERWTVYKNLLGEIQKLQKEAQDPIVNNETRGKKGAELQEKAKELRALETELRNLRSRCQSTSPGQACAILQELNHPQAGQHAPLPASEIHTHVGAVHRRKVGTNA